mmetsp:Transcript_9999/g.9686  ORF Transcript_9999/g.9686 Transcript_9999/m.9686 type:complete len:489 (-) Transcript_9999:269-1735(-)
MKLAFTTGFFAIAISSYSASAFSQSNGLKYFSSSAISADGSTNQRTGVRLMAKIPMLKEWRITRNGGIEGIVSNHPSADIDDGDTLATSRLKNPDAVRVGVTVQTRSGSSYKLGPTKLFKAPTKFSVEKKKKENSFSLFPFLNSKADSNGKEKKTVPEKGASIAITKSKPTVTPSKKKMTKREAVNKFKLNGKSIGSKKYLLSGKPERSTSGKSTIWSGYRAGKDGLPEGKKFTVKLSSNFEAMERENDNYERITASGVTRGQFVNKIDFLSNAGPQSPFNKKCALVIDYGLKDLRQLLTERGYEGLEGRSLREAAVALVECVRAVHASKLVWTDCKTENFVILSEDLGFQEGLEGVKGIDLESAISVGGNPVDFSPEACPPEFAKAFVNGDAFDFILEYNYDIWSLGMLLYELSTGDSYFSGKSPSQVTKMLSDVENFEIDLSAVTDRRLRDLIGKCLQKNPRRRPTINQVLLQPYFVSSGIGPFSF